ncbi:MAG: hypothetical protein E7595_06370 [Ruminococcaceae bacterium]|nr:hypothetical protein [Oscillospiraceae bacterium]
MMKLAKRSAALLLCVATILSFCIVVSAAPEDKATVVVGNTVNIDGAVSYSSITITSGQNGNVVPAYSMEFDPEDGYIPMVFSGYSGTSGVLATQYDIATQKYGYEVAGIINGAFFSMDSGTTTYGNYGTLVGIVISNGKIASAHTGYSDSVVAFGSDGSMNIVNSKLDYKLYIKGEEIKNGIYYINKTSGSKVASNWNNGFYYYDTSCGRVCDTFAVCPGYEVICEKVDNTDLSVGATLKGKVLEVKENSYGAALAENKMDFSNKFVLFVKTASPNAKYVKDLVAGDTINIGVSETNEAAKEVMENANSVISNVGWLVKDGVDRTRIDTTIGTHGVTLDRGWTAFGQKADGSYVFYTSKDGGAGTGNCVTMRDVADYMISAGCVNVIRMDGGGSCAMYVSDTGSGEPGYAQYSSRSVGDCILVVKKSSLVDEDLESALQAKIDEAKASLESAPNDAIAELVAAAEAVLAEETPVSSDVRKALADLSSALSGKDELSDAVALAGGISYKDYSEAVLTEIREVYDEAVALLGEENADLEAIKAVTAELKSLLSLTGKSNLPLSVGKPYTTSNPTRGDGWDDDGIRLTDGQKNFAEGGSVAYSGWGGINVEAIIDLEEVTASNTYTVYAAAGFWGISAPEKVEVSISTDGETYKSIGTATATETGDGGQADGNTIKLYKYELTTAKKNDARYIKFNITRVGTFIWIDEIEASLCEDVVSDAIYVTGFNTSIGAGNCNIFTPEFGPITKAAANHKWTTNVVLEKTEIEGEYIVVKKFKGNGDTTPDITLEDNQIMIAAHSWEGSGVTDPVEGSRANEVLLSSAEVGKIIKLYGINADALSLGVAAYAKIVEEEIGMLGDVNNDEAINQYDYILVKRHYFETRYLTDDEMTRADVNGDGNVNQYDYILIKRHYFGTYVIG